MPRLSELVRGTSLVGLVYGGAGSGKTEFCGTAGSRSLFINIGKGIETLHSPGFKSRNPDSDPIIETIFEEYLPEKAEGHNKLTDLLDLYLDPKHPMFNEFDTVIIDDATALKRMARNLALEINRDLNKSQSLEQSKKHRQVVTAVQDFGEEMNIVNKFIVDYSGICKSYNKHFIVTAHERLTFKQPVNSQGKAIFGASRVLDNTRPGFTGETFPDDIQGEFDFVWHMETQGGADRIFHFARTKGDSQLAAKTRWDGLFPIRWQNPNFLKAVDAVRNNKPIVK
jgi:hypothetical protein